MKRKLWLLSFIVAIFLILSVIRTYALFETDAEGKLTSEIGKWVIKLNDILITEEQKEAITIDKFVYTDNENIADNKIAPGRSGYFDIIIDPSGTDVAIKFDVEFDFSEYYSGSITNNITVVNGNELVKTGPNKYTGVYSIEDMKNPNNLQIRVEVNWQDLEDFNEDDTKLGIVEKNKIKFPVTVNAVQYFGEEIIEYVEPEEEEQEEIEEEEAEENNE